MVEHKSLLGKGRCIIRKLLEYIFFSIVVVYYERGLLEML